MAGFRLKKGSKLAKKLKGKTSVILPGPAMARFGRGVKNKLTATEIKEIKNRKSQLALGVKGMLKKFPKETSEEIKKGFVFSKARIKFLAKKEK